MGEVKAVPVDGKLLEEAEAVGLNVRELVESELRRMIEKKRLAHEWYEQNREAVDAYNARIDSDGVIGDEHRRYG